MTVGDFIRYQFEIIGNLEKRSMGFPFPYENTEQL